MHNGVIAPFDGAALLLRAGSALKGLTEDDMLEEHRKSGPRTKAKGKWLEQTIAETMVSMSEDLYDTDDDEAPFNIKKLLRRPSRDPKVPTAAHVAVTQASL